MFWKPITCMPVGATVPAFLFIAMKIKLISKYSSFPSFLIFFLTHSVQFIALFDGIHTANRLAPGIREHIRVRAVYEKSVISSGITVTWHELQKFESIHYCRTICWEKSESQLSTLLSQEPREGKGPEACHSFQPYLHFFFIFKASSENVIMCILTAN